jgi:hypothetical protein
MCKKHPQRHGTSVGHGQLSSIPPVFLLQHFLECCFFVPTNLSPLKRDPAKAVANQIQIYKYFVILSRLDEGSQISAEFFYFNLW